MATETTEPAEPERSTVDGEMLRDIAAICWASASRLLANGTRTAGDLLTDISRRLEEAEPDRELPGVRGPADSPG